MAIDRVRCGAINGINSSFSSSAAKRRDRCWMSSKNLCKFNRFPIRSFFRRKQSRNGHRQRFWTQLLFEDKCFGQTQCLRLRPVERVDGVNDFEPISSQNPVGQLVAGCGTKRGSRFSGQTPGALAISGIVEVLQHHAHHLGAGQLETHRGRHRAVALCALQQIDTVNITAIDIL